jgi:hypothetical protein
MTHIRINLHQHRPKSKRPAWQDALMNDAIRAFAAEWQVHAYEAFDHMCTRDTIAELAEVIKCHTGAMADSYVHPWLPSYGLVLQEDDPVVVMYKLRHVDEAEDQ